MKLFWLVFYWSIILYSIYLGLSQGNPHLCLFFYGFAIIISVAIKPKNIDGLALVTLIIFLASGGIINYSS
ncbi:hypothetical protein N9835_02405 [Alphaproteobacteria bacterium]|nr:hypothetical protein [Alphaproteobacteria bacterium]